MLLTWRLARSAAAFAVYAQCPFIDIEPRYDLEATAEYMLERNDWIVGAQSRQQLAGKGYGPDNSYVSSPEYAEASATGYVLRWCVRLIVTLA